MSELVLIVIFEITKHQYPNKLIVGVIFNKKKNRKIFIYSPFRFHFFFFNPELQTVIKRNILVEYICQRLSISEKSQLLQSCLLAVFVFLFGLATKSIYFQ